MPTNINIIEQLTTNAPAVGEILVSELLDGFNWILSITDRDKFYASRSVRDLLEATPSKISSTPIISVDSGDLLISNINTDIDNTLDFEVSEIIALSDNDIIQIVINSVGISEKEVDIVFSITPKEIQLESPFEIQPTFDGSKFDIVTTELKPTSPPSGFIPIIRSKINTLSPQGQWKWNGFKWIRV